MPARKTSKSRSTLPVTTRAAQVLDRVSARVALAPDENAAEVAALRAALKAEFAPTGVVADLILRDILQVQLELDRLERSGQMLINTHAADHMELHLMRSAPGLSAAEARALARSWALGSGRAQGKARREIAALGVNEAEVLARTHAALAEVLSLARRDEERLEGRRRKLLEDYGRANGLAAGEIEDAEVIDGA
ncbi:hypothetical protein [Sinisalibacter lacisalsi]|uniref:Uncharacterized protein n=1 Tax=Sinisalibacter lacisalsi TaxID=1526570 RepID=A0ABQ1QLK0_9RHOB|nr:hypothetical protein [Sinisalibacter lacisalsi]GGD30194.1 hypothetical protein GCM10011358_12800 [Sinisalibacter lacisalsi]